ncbi:hypothetical protein VTK73DRAFT_8797 [Phialemonium thermophilum]|uniref:Uncharacterized protein n=1 Tax=Phialemonium thermophilum TaxID=223376 RepID=A0ABR3W6E2_9PEZI
MPSAHRRMSTTPTYVDPGPPRGAFSIRRQGLHERAARPCMLIRFTTSGQCCPNRNNGSAVLLPSPRCADESWDMYDNGGFFCCAEGRLGYAASDGVSDGCAAQESQLGAGDKYLPTVSQVRGPCPAALCSRCFLSRGPKRWSHRGAQLTKGDVPIPRTAEASTSSPSPTSSPPVTATETAPAARSPQSSSHAEPIAGGVVGGVVGVAAIVVAVWFVWRRRRRAGREDGVHPEADGAEKNDGELPHAELSRIRVQELDQGATCPPAQLADGPITTSCRHRHVFCTVACLGVLGTSVVREDHDSKRAVQLHLPFEMGPTKRDVFMLTAWTGLHASLIHAVPDE